LFLLSREVTTMTTPTRESEKARLKEAMLKNLAEETAGRARRHHRVGVVLGGVAIAMLYAGLIALPFSAACFALAFWAMKDAYAADAELRMLQARLLPAIVSNDKPSMLPT
jgi:hypothetical protein